MAALASFYPLGQTFLYLHFLSFGFGSDFFRSSRILSISGCASRSIFAAFSIPILPLQVALAPIRLDHLQYQLDKLGVVSVLYQARL